MAFEVGRTYQTRGGEEVTIKKDDGDRKGRFQCSDGIWRHANGEPNIKNSSHLDLLPTPIDAPTDGEEVKPVIDQDWKDDARAALAALITGRNWGHINGEDATIQAWANGAAKIADALAAIRAERGRVG